MEALGKSKTEPDWIIDVQGTRIGKLSRGQSFVHLLVALLVLAAGYRCCSLAVSLGIFNTGSGSTAGNHAENRLLAAFDELELEPYEKLVTRKSTSRSLAMGAQNLAYRLDLSFTPSGVNLLLIKAVIFDSRTGKEIDRLTTYRSNRSK